jgi:hypothetical protein
LIRHAKVVGRVRQWPRAKSAHSVPWRRLRYGVWFLGLLLVTSCLSLPVPGRDSASSGEVLAWKVIVDKRETNLLIALDRTYCEVAPDRFDKVEEGERVFCHWR